jgi:threonine dehydratase
MFTLDELDAAAALVHRQVPPTPQYAWPLLGERLGCPVVVKHENHTPIGAFKIRGGPTFMAWLKRQHPDVAGVVCATRGNHGQSVAFAARQAGLSCTVVVPRGNSVEKNAAMQALGGELVEAGEDFQESLEHAGRLAAERGLYPMPSYHRELVRGIASYGLELFRAFPDLSRVYVPIGLGSGINGVISAREALGLSCEIVGVVSAHALAYLLSFQRGQFAESPATTLLGDGMACRTPNAEALETIWKHVSRVVSVDDDELAAAMRLYYAATHNLAEGAGAAALAAALKEPQRRDRSIGVVLSGGNVDRPLYARVLAGERFMQASAA